MFMKYAWLTDIHLDMFGDQITKPIEAIAKSVAAKGAEGIILTGDITTAPNIVMALSILSFRGSSCRT